MDYLSKCQGIPTDIFLFFGYSKGSYLLKKRKNNSPNNPEMGVTKLSRNGYH